MKQIKVKGGFVALVDDKDFESLNQHSWYEGNGYAWRTSGKGGAASMHRDIMGNPKGKAIDHINGDRLDNRRENLRVCTHSQNLMNSKRASSNKSGYKGVSSHGGKWLVHICKQQKTMHVGIFSDIIEAARAYDAKARELFGEFARLNFPDNS